METFGDRVREARKKRGMTQKQLASASGLSQTTISDIERGRNDSSADIVPLARALGVNAEWLADGRGPRYPGGQPPAMPPPAAAAQTHGPKDGKDGKDGASLLRRFADLYKEYEKLPAKEKALMDEALAQQAELRRMIKGGDD